MKYFYLGELQCYIFNSLIYAKVATLLSQIYSRKHLTKLIK